MGVKGASQCLHQGSQPMSASLAGSLDVWASKEPANVYPFQSLVHVFEALHYLCQDLFLVCF